MAAGLGLVAALLFLAIVGNLLREGLFGLTWHFLVGYPNQLGGGGIGPELLNTIVMVGATLIVTAPLGLLVAVFQREYRPGWGRPLPAINRLQATLLSAPTIVVALVVYRVAVGWWHWPVSILTGCVALAVINWPFMILVADQALASVPDRYRLASRALGATRFETAWKVSIPASLHVLVEGWGLGFARLAGESAALIVTAGVNVSRHWSFWGPGETLAVHIWYVRTEGLALNRDAEAAATGIALMLLITAVIWLSERLARVLRVSGENRE